MSGLVASPILAGPTAMVHLYGLIIGLSIVIGIDFFTKHNHTVPPHLKNPLILGTILCAIIGARTYHVIDQWSFYSQHLNLIPQTWNGGLGIFGGIIGAFIYILLFSIILKIPLLSITDSIVPILPLCQAVGRIGNFVNQENPVWWFEAILNLVLFFILRSNALKNYSSTALYLIGYGLIRFVTEFWRHDTWIIDTIKIGQIIAIMFIIIGLCLIPKNTLPPSKKP